MDLKVTAHRLCLLLSWQEALGRTPHNASYGGASYRKHAARAIATLRDEARAEVQRAGSELQRLIAANAPASEADRQRHRIQQLNHLLKAETASTLGGPVALSLEGYADAFGVAQPSPMSFTPLERRDVITIWGALLIGAVVCLALSWFYLWRANTSFSTEWADNNFLALQMSNEGQKMAEFVGSWSSITSESIPDTYAVALYCQPEGEDAFQPATDLDGIWVYQNEVMAPQRIVSVEPGVSITVLLDVRALESIYGRKLAAIRLECGRKSSPRQAVFTEQVPTP